MNDRETNELFVNKLIERLEIREQSYMDGTESVFELLRDNIVAAFDEVLELPSEQIKWLDIALDMDQQGIYFLILTFSLSYFAYQANDYIIKNFENIEPEPERESDENDDGGITRIITFGIPAMLAHLPKSNIIEFIVGQNPNMNPPIQEETNTEPNKFDLSSLTDIQRRQIQLFTTGTVH
jgi:hypothetical protein